MDEPSAAFVAATGFAHCRESPQPIGMHMGILDDVAFPKCLTALEEVRIALASINGRIMQKNEAVYKPVPFG